LTSLEEVENGLVAFGKEQDRYQALVESENANRRAVELADSRYRSGLVDFLNVLDTEGSLWPFKTNSREANKRWVKILSVFTRRSVEVGRMIANQM
jgi:outer membrane protein TolC